MPSLAFEQLECAVVESVKTTLEAQFGFRVQQAAVDCAPTQSFWRNTVLEADIVLKSAVDAVELKLFVACETISQCMLPLVGCELAIDDPCVLESPGEFLNVSAGLVRKHLNSVLQLELDMTCAENKGTVSLIEFENQNKVRSTRSVMFLFNTTYGDVFFVFRSDTINVTRKSLAS